jgi:hypothetical protein
MFEQTSYASIPPFTQNPNVQTQTNSQHDFCHNFFHPCQIPHHCK